MDELTTHLQHIRKTSEESAKIAEDSKTSAKDAQAAAQDLKDLSSTVGELVSDIDAMSEPMEQNAQSSERLTQSLGDIVDLITNSHQKLQLTTERTDDTLGISEDFMGFVVSSGVETSDSLFIETVRFKAAEISNLFERAINANALTQRDLFDRSYRPIENTNPSQVSTKYLRFTDKHLPKIQEPVLQMDDRIAFCAAVDVNGYLPTHNNVYAQPQSDDPEWNSAKCRNRRIFDDRTGLAAGRNTKPFLLQTYRRDMGAGNFVLMKDVSAPIVVNGHHWGGLRIAYKV